MEIIVKNFLHYNEIVFYSIGLFDKYSNIFDILGNCQEWTTEYSSCTDLLGIIPYVYRGGYFDEDSCAANRHDTRTSAASPRISFRLQLYVNSES